MRIEAIYRSQFDEVDQGFHETADRDRAVRDKLEKILVSIDQGEDNQSPPILVNRFWRWQMPRKV
jgi:hypothetical protein